MEVLEIPVFCFYKVIEIVNRVEKGLSRDVVKHLNHVSSDDDYDDVCGIMVTVTNNICSVLLNFKIHNACLNKFEYILYIVQTKLICD